MAGYLNPIPTALVKIKWYIYPNNNPAIKMAGYPYPIPTVLNLCR